MGIFFLKNKIINVNIRIYILYSKILATEWFLFALDQTERPNSYNGLRLHISIFNHIPRVSYIRLSEGNYNLYDKINK